MLNKCGLCHFRCFIQLIKVTVSFESLGFFVRSVFCIFVFVFVFFPCLSLFYFQLSGVIGVFSVKTLFIFFVPFSYLSYFLRFFQLRFHFFISAHFFFSSLLLSVSNSPTLSRHGNPPVRSTHSLSNKTLFHGCVTIDDRHSSQIRLPRESSLVQPLAPGKVNLVSAQIASFLVCYTLVRLGFCIGLQKSILQPSQSVPYLGFQCDSRLQAFCLLSHKKQKFISPVEAILNSSHVSITDLQRLAGKCISMSLAVPGARLFTDEINLAISRASRSSRPLPLSGPLRREIEHWLFLKSWSGFLPWRSERHHQFVLFTDASSYRWAGVLNPNAVPLSASNYWSEEILSSPIAVKEALALSNALSSFASTIKDSTQLSRTLFHAWNGQSTRSHSFSEALKSIFEALMSTNCFLRLFQVPSVNNLADRPSRSLSLSLSGGFPSVCQLLEATTRRAWWSRWSFS